jgi:hypothetical protein
VLLGEPALVPKYVAGRRKGESAVSEIGDYVDIGR